MYIYSVIDEIIRWDLYKNLMIPVLVALSIYLIIFLFNYFREIKVRDNFLNLYQKYILNESSGDLFSTRVPQYEQAKENILSFNSVAIINEYGSGKTFFTEKVLQEFKDSRIIINISLIDYIHKTPIEAIIVTALYKEGILTKKDANKLYAHMKDNGRNLIFKTSPNFTDRMFIINQIINLINSSNKGIVIIIDDIVRSDREDINEMLSMLKYINDKCNMVSFVYLLSNNHNLSNDWRKLMTPPYLYKYATYLIYLRYYKLSDYLLNDLWDSEVEMTEYIKYLIVMTINEFNDRNIDDHNKKIVDYRNIEKMHKRVMISLQSKSEDDFIKTYIKELFNKKYSQHGKVQFNNHHFNQSFSLDIAPMSANELILKFNRRTCNEIAKEFWDSWKKLVENEKKVNTLNKYRGSDTKEATKFMWPDDLSSWRALIIKYDSFNSHLKNYLFICKNNNEYIEVMKKVNAFISDISSRINQYEINMIRRVGSDFSISEITEELVDFLNTFNMDWRLEIMKCYNGKEIINSLTDNQLIR